MSSKYSTSELHSPSFCTEDLHLRMCKKIADLTRVVDKLFRQYYEQSSHYSSLKKKHHLQKLENEELKQDKQTDLNKIETCRKEIEDLRRENSQLSEEISVLKRKVSCAEFEKTMLLEESEQLKQTLRDVRDKMNEMQNKLNELCEQRTACCGHVELIEALEKKVYKQSCEFDQLSKDKQSQDSNYIDLQNRYKLASEENVLLKSRLEEFKSSLDNLQEEKQSLQIQITQLLKELQEYKSSLEHLQGAKRASSIRKKKAPTFHPKREYWLQKPPKEERDRELERLREELQRYRLELMNRESNFNRVFTDHTPVHMKSRPVDSATNDGYSINLPKIQTSNNHRALGSRQ